MELLASVPQTLEAILEAAGERAPATDLEWACDLRARHIERSARLPATMRNAPAGIDGLMHPNRVLAACAMRCLLTRWSWPMVVTSSASPGSDCRRAPISTRDRSAASVSGRPYGVAASLARPDQTVVVATGDGAFGFNAMEVDNAVRHRAPLLVVVANNGSWAIEVRDQQETHGKVVGTRLQFADHAAMARGFGMHAERVERAEDLPGAIERALANRPALLDVLVTPEAVSSDARSGLAWVPDVQPLAAWDDAERNWRRGSGSIGELPA